MRNHGVTGREIMDKDERFVIKCTGISNIVGFENEDGNLNLEVDMNHIATLTKDEAFNLAAWLLHWHGPPDPETDERALSKELGIKTMWYRPGIPSGFLDLEDEDEGGCL